MWATNVTPIPTAAGLRLEVTVVELGSTDSTVPERSTLTGLLAESEVTDSTPVPGAPTETGVNSTARRQLAATARDCEVEHVVVIGSVGLVSNAASVVAGSAVRSDNWSSALPSFSNFCAMGADVLPSFMVGYCKVATVALISRMRRSRRSARKRLPAPSR